MLFFRHVYILLWKNFLLKKRAWGSTLLEILLPLVVGLAMISIRGAVKKENTQPSN